MVKERFELSRLRECSPEILAWTVPATRLFSWVCRAIDIPPGWLALGARRGRDPVLVKPGGRYDDDGTEELLFIRAEAARFAVEADGLCSADGHACSGTLELGLQLIHEPAEIAAFRRTIMRAAEITRRADLQRQARSAMVQALSELASAHPARQLTGPLDAGRIRECVEQHLGGFCLAAGLTLEGPVTASFDSPAWREAQREQAAAEHRDRHLATRARIQQAVARAQSERLGHLGNLLEQLRRAADSRADLSVRELLRAFAEPERAEMYAALWQLVPPARRTARVAVVSGQEVLLFEPAGLHRPSARIVLPASLGPLRSVSVDPQSLEAGLLMVGARLGVHLVHWESGELIDSLSGADLDSADLARGGVNAAAMSDRNVYATHSELGLLVWPRGMFSGPVERLLPEITAGAQTIRCALVGEGRFWFAVDENVWAAAEPPGESPPVRYAGSRFGISALAISGGTVYAGNSAGQILSWPVGDPDFARVVRGPSHTPVESIQVLDNGAVEQLLIADRGTVLQAMVVDDSYVRRYESRSTPIRRAAAADDLFVGMNDNRDRLVAWDPARPSAPLATVIVPHLTGETVQDLCVVPAAGPAAAQGDRPQDCRS
jgi:hypothetical protein